MRKNIVVSVTGPDKPGVVDTVTKALLNLDGNVETSRMIRLGGEFGMLMLVSFPEEEVVRLGQAVENLAAHGYKMTTSQTEQSYAQRYSGWKRYQIEVLGADHEGIINNIAHYLSGYGINIEQMDTETGQAPMSGAPLFRMVAQVVVPPNLSNKDWKMELDEIGHNLNVDVVVTAI